jgi:hypothetical protein
MILNDFERPGIWDLFIDFRVSDEQTYLDEIEIPKNVPYMIEFQENDNGDMCTLDIINFPEFLKRIDEDKYLPDLGNFTYGNFKDMPLKEILKQINFSGG